MKYEHVMEEENIVLNVISWVKTNLEGAHLVRHGLHLRPLSLGERRLRVK